jgi:hypothetical protein
MAFAVDDAPTPNTLNSSVARTREYLTGKEVEKLMEAARKSSRYGHRDATMILIAYRHGLRACAICNGTRSKSIPGGYTCAEPSEGLRAFTQSRATNCGRCVVSSASSHPARMYLPATPRLRLRTSKFSALDDVRNGRTVARRQYRGLARSTMLAAIGLTAA